MIQRIIQVSAQRRRDRRSSSVRRLLATGNSWHGHPMMRAAPKPDIHLKRAYEPPSPDEGRRILVARLWPRGLRKADAAIDRWVKEITPSSDLRRWFGHDPSRWEEFRQRYRAELSSHSELLAEVRAFAQGES
jgi:uncharacterized protein YeaO (DUF488 family)